MKYAFRYTIRELNSCTNMYKRQRQSSLVDFNISLVDFIVY